MHKIVDQKIISSTAITENETNLNVPSTLIDKGNADTEVVKVSGCVSRSFPLSICMNNFDSTRNFYNNILGIKQRRATKSSLHFDFISVNLAFHEVASYSAKNIQREVEAEDVAAPKCGTAFTLI